MLKIWSMKQEQQKNEAAAGQSKKKKVTAAQLRVQKGKFCFLSHSASEIARYKLPSSHHRKNLTTDPSILAIQISPSSPWGAP
jgi:hypothetical protein